MKPRPEPRLIVFATNDIPENNIEKLANDAMIQSDGTRKIGTMASDCFLSQTTQSQNRKSVGDWKAQFPDLKAKISLIRHSSRMPRKMIDIQLPRKRLII